MQRLVDAEKLGLTDFEIAMCDGDYKEALKMVLSKIENAPTVWVMDEESHRCLTFPKEKGTAVRHGRWDKDIIYRQNAIELAMQYCPDDDGTCSKADEDMRNLLDELENLPSAVVEAEPVRHGHWCVTQAYPHTIYCSECFKRFAQAHWAVWEDGSLPRDYCPNCGAKMDEPVNLNEREKSYYDTERDD